MGGVTNWLSETNAKVFGKVFGMKSPKESVPKKTDEQLADEAAAAEAARQEQLKTEREKSSRQRGKSGRQALSYKGPSTSTTGGSQDKLGGGL